MSTAVRIEHTDVDEIPFQEASLDIWDRKYRLTAKDGTPIDATMDDTLARVARTLAFIDGIDPAGFEGSDDRPILLRPGTPKERSIGGQAYLLNYGLPQFFFHVTTAYALLRHYGIGIGKKDYMGAY